ncbi:MAG: 6-phosphogluconolactonase [Verrucomicrobiota bacterium]|jgi:6-phosphogluconolactonase
MKLMEDEVDVFTDIQTLTAAAARRFAFLASKAVEERGVFAVALSGGLTLGALYQLMATDKTVRSEIPWSKVHFFFGDERHVPPGHPHSNFRMVSEAMFLNLRTEHLHIHRVLGELASACQAAEEYEADLRGFFEPRGLLDEGFPRFDLAFLRMGHDGHTASLFPNSSGLHETARWVVSNWVEELKKDRITMTFPVLNSAAEVILFVSGSGKASLVAEVLGQPVNGLKYPIQEVRPRNGIKRWMLDTKAAAGIGMRPNAWSGLSFQ